MNFIHFDEHIFQMGWNHQLVQHNYLTELKQKGKLDPFEQWVLSSHRDSWESKRSPYKGAFWVIFLPESEVKLWISIWRMGWMNMKMGWMKSMWFLRFQWESRWWWFQTSFFFHPSLGKISNLASIFYQLEMDWFNHQLAQDFVCLNGRNRKNQTPIGVCWVGWGPWWIPNPGWSTSRNLEKHLVDILFSWFQEDFQAESQHECMLNRIGMKCMELICISSKEHFASRLLRTSLCT